MHQPAAFFTVLLLSTTFIAAKPSSKPDLDKSKVFIPWQEFKQIIDRLAQPASVKNDTIFAPTDYVLTSAQISGTVMDNRSAQFTVRCALTVLPSRTLKENGWATVKLGPVNSTAVLEEVTADGKALPLLTEDSEYRLMFSKAGVYQLRCAYHCAVESNEGTSTIHLFPPKTLAAELDFTLAGTRADITVNGVNVAVENNGKGVQVRTPIANSSHELRIDYTPLGGTQESGEDTTRITPRVYAATGLLADIRENQIRYQYRIDYQIWHKKITSFAIALPDTFAIEEVEGAGIARWKMERRDGKPVLLVQTNFTPEKNYSLTVRFGRKLENMAVRIPVPSLQPLNVNRENGCLAVVSQQTMEVAIADSLSGLTAVDQSELHPWMRNRQDLLMRFKYIHPPYSLSLDVKRHSDMPVLVAIADDVTFTSLLTEEGYVLSQFRYHIRNNHKQYLCVKMTGGWRLWSALIDGGPVMPATSGDEEVLIPLKKMSSNDNGQGFRLELVYWKEWKKMGFRGNFSFVMPDIDINVQKIAGDLWVPKKFRYSGFNGSLAKTAMLTRASSQAEPDTWSTANVGQQRSRRFGTMANQQMTQSRKGMTLTLPVEISVPAEGTHFRFAKNLTISGEKADLSFSFRKRLPDVGIPFGLFFPIAFFLTGFICLRKFLGQWVRKSRIKTCAAGLFVMMFLLILQGLFGTTLPGVSLFFLGSVAGVVVHCAYGLKRDAAGSTAMLLLMFCLALAPPAFSQDEEESEDPQLTGSTVALPWSDFKQILERIRKPETRDTAESVVPPVAYVIGSGDYRGERLNEKRCVFTAQLNISVLEKRSWVEIRLVEGVAIFPDVKVSTPPGGTASIGTNEAQSNLLLLKGAGNYTVVFRFVTTLQEQSGVATIRFPLPEQTATSLHLILDKPDYHVTANGIPLVPRAVGPGRGMYRYEGAIGRNSNAIISWRQEVTQISAQDAMLLGQVNTFYSIGLGLIQMTSEIDLSIIHQAIREFTFSLPRPVTVVDLTGPAVLTWEKADTAGGSGPQTIRVLFKYSVKNRASFELTAEQTYGDSVPTLSLPDLNLGNASRQEGFFAVGVTSNIELKQRDLSANVLRRDRRELPPWFENAEDILFSYQYLSGSYKVNFSIDRHDNLSGLAALVERADARSVIREDGKTITELTMRVVNRGEQFLRVNWRSGRQLWSLYCNNKPARPAFDSTTAQLLIPLEKTAEQSAATSVKLVYLEQNRRFGIAGRHRLMLPEVNMPAQNINAVVYVPTPIDVMHTSGNLHPAESEKRRWSPWFTSVFGVMRNLLTLHQKEEVFTDYYEKIPEERVASLQKDEVPKTQQVFREEALADKKKLAPAPKRSGGGGDPRARVKEKGVLGIVSGLEKRKEIASANMFGKGGYAADIDAVLESESGSDDIGELITGPSGSAAEPQVPLPPPSGAEAGQLSLPINVTYDGTPHSFSSALMKNGASLRISFFYRKVPAHIPLVVHLLIFMLMVIAGAYLTVSLWSGWNLRRVLWGIAGPSAAALILCRILDKPLGVDGMLLVPVLFFVWKALVYAVRLFKNRKKRRSETMIKPVSDGTAVKVPETTSASSEAPSDNQPPVKEGGN